MVKFTIFNVEFHPVVDCHS